MAYPIPKNLAAIALSGFSGVGITIAFLVFESGSDVLAIAVFAITGIVCPTIAGCLSTRAGNVVAYPAAVLVGLIIAVPSVEINSHPAFWVAYTTFFFGGMAYLTFFAGWGV